MNRLGKRLRQRPGRLRRLWRLFREVHWRRLPRATRYYLLLTGFVGFAAFNTINNLLYMVAGLMVALLVVSAILARAGVRRLRLTRQVPAHIYAGDPVTVRLILQNQKKRLATFALRIQDAIDGAPTHEAFILALPPGEARGTHYEHAFTRRGHHTFDALGVQTAFPFGFFPRTVTLRAPQPVVVYPQIDPVDDVLLGAIVDPQSFAHLARGEGANIYGVRAYRSGDDARHISWKLSAKAGRLLIREFEAEKMDDVTLIFDNALANGRPLSASRFEAAVRLTASLLWALVDRHFTVRLVTRAGRSPSDRGQQHLYKLLWELAVIEPIHQDTSGAIPKLPIHDVNPALSAVVLADPDATWPAGGRFPVVLAPRLVDERVVHSFSRASKGAGG